MSELKKKSEEGLRDSAGKLKKAVDNFNDTINRKA